MQIPESGIRNPVDKYVLSENRHEAYFSDFIPKDLQNKWTTSDCAWCIPMFWLDVVFWQSTTSHILILPFLITKIENEQQTKDIIFQTRDGHEIYHKKSWIWSKKYCDGRILINGCVSFIIQIIKMLLIALWFFYETLRVVKLIMNALLSVKCKLFIVI